MVNINKFLMSSYRTDIIGPEMWNGKINEGKSMLIEEKDYFVRPDKQIGGYSAQLPQYAWDPPQPGLPGTWAYVHHTNLSDVVQLKITDALNGKDLDFIATRNRWTPAWLETYYRSVTDVAYKYGGTLTFKETRCITTDNVFYAECVLINDCNAAREYLVTVELPCFKALGNYVWEVDAAFQPGGLLYGKEKLRYRGFAALASDYGGQSLSIVMQPYERVVFRYAMAVDGVAAEALRKVENAIADTGVVTRNEQSFNRWMADNAPLLESDDTELLKLYYYRWFLLYRAAHNPSRVMPEHPYEHPALYESPFGLWFGCAIGLPVPCQIMESRWLKEQTTAAGHILNWCGKTRGYMNYLQYTPMAIWQWYLVTGERAVLKKAYSAMREYALKDIDTGDGGKLPVQCGSWMTGAEYQPNFYQFTKPEQWDWRQDEEGAEKWQLPVAALIRPDLCAHTLANIMAVACAAAELGYGTDAKEFRELADCQRGSMIKILWNDELKAFTGADPATFEQTDEALCYDSFLPFLWGMLGAEYGVTFRNLFDNMQFWDEFPVASASKTAAMYWSGNCIAGPTHSSQAEPHIYPCSWNGPSWHYANGLVTSAYGRYVHACGTSEDKEKWLELFGKWSELHFLYGDRSTPCAVEHNRPSDGARFRSVTDYFHNAWLDVFFSCYAGIVVEEDRIQFVPFCRESFCLKGVVIRSKEYDFEQVAGKNGVVIRKISIGGALLVEADNGAAELPLPND